jgi:hypothetical protein
VHTLRKKRCVFPEESEGGIRIAFWARSCNRRVPAETKAGEEDKQDKQAKTRVRTTSPSGFDDPRAPNGGEEPSSIRRPAPNLVSCFGYLRTDHDAAFRYYRGKRLAAYTEGVERMLLFCSLSPGKLWIASSYVD